MDNIEQMEIRINAQAILDPNMWIQTANNLMHSAECLKPSVKAFWASKGKGINTHRTYLMLIGFAIENFIKAVLASKLTQEEKEEVMSTGKLPNNFKEHCSAQLIENSLGISLSNEVFSLGTESLIERIDEAVIWSGRYPSKVNPSGILVSSNDGQYMSYLYSSDVMRAMDTAKKIKELVNEEIRPWAKV